MPRVITPSFKKQRTPVFLLGIFFSGVLTLVFAGSFLVFPQNASARAGTACPCSGTRSSNACSRWHRCASGVVTTYETLQCVNNRCAWVGHTSDGITMNCCTPPNVCGGAVPNAQCSAPDHPEPTLTATLTASPTSGTTQTTFTFTAWIGGAEGGTAASYTRPSCGTDGTIVPGSHTDSTDNTFQCTYTTPGDKTAAISAARAGVGARRPTATVTVTDPTPTLTASLSASPTSGTTQDTFCDKNWW